jgi:hypothetical protein
MESVTIKKNSDVENCLGKNLAKEILNIYKKDNRVQNKPKRIYFETSKPKFCLNDGSTLKCYVVDLSTSKVIGNRYCGSGCSTISHQPEQLSEGFEPPLGHALLFVESYYMGGDKHAWDLTVVSTEIVKQVA